MIKINHKTLKTLLGGVLFGTKKVTYPGDVLAHVAMESANGILSFTTCDGCRISQRSTLYNTEDFSVVFHVDGITAVYKQLNTHTYDYVEIDIVTGQFKFFGYSIFVDIMPLKYINPDNYIPHWRDAQAWIELNPKQLWCLIPKPTKKEQRLTLRLDPEHAYLGLSIPKTLGLRFDIKYEKTPQEDISKMFNYNFFYQALTTFKNDDKITIKFFEGYRGVVLSGDKEYYWILPIRGEE